MAHSAVLLGYILSSGELSINCFVVPGTAIVIYNSVQAQVISFCCSVHCFGCSTSLTLLINT